MLQDWHIVILRARHQADALAKALSKQNAITHIVPLIDIIPLDSSQHLDAWQAIIAQTDFLIVTSANAVDCAPQSVMKALNPNAFVLTMGKSTTQALNEKYPHLKVSYTAPNGATSESVLLEAYLENAQVKHKNVALLAGEGGRTVFADTLTARQAKVQWIKVYRQEKPKHDMDSIIKSLQENKKVGFIATSSRIVENLLSYSASTHAWLLEQPLVVVSPRIAEKAQSVGFKRVYIAQGAQTEAILHACENLSLSL